MIFTSVTKTAGVASDYPPLNVPNQRAEVNKHGSGGGYDTSLAGPSPSYYKGDKYVAVYPSVITGSQTLEFHVSSGGGYGSTQPVPNPPAFVSITPIDRVIYPNGRQGETLHSGFRHGASHTFAAEREEAYVAMIDWCKANLPNIDWSHCISGGTIGGHINNSMGAWAMLRLDMRHPELFPFVGGSSPRFKGSSVKDWETSGDMTTPLGQLMDDGSDYAAQFDFVALVNDLTVKLPFVMWTTSTADGFTPFADCQSAIAALRARIRNPVLTNDKRSGFAVGWVPGAHGQAGPGTAVLNAMNASYPRAGWKLGQGYPVFDRSSLDADPMTAPGPAYINRGFVWTTPIETATLWSTTVGNTLGACTVEVWPHSETFLAPVSAPVLVTIPDATTKVAVSFSGGVAQPPLPDPVIVSFTAVPPGTTFGQSAVLSAVVTNAVSLTVDGLPATLPMTVTPTASHTYTLVATGAAGTTPATATVTVTVSATADPCQPVIDERNALNAKIAAAVAILTA